MTNLLKFPSEARELQKLIEEIDYKKYHLNKHHKALLKVLASNPKVWHRDELIRDKIGDSLYKGRSRLQNLGLIQESIVQGWAVGKVLVELAGHPRWEDGEHPFYPEAVYKYWETYKLEVDKIVGLDLKSEKSSPEEGVKKEKEKSYE